MRRLLALATFALLLPSASCVGWFFSGEDYANRSRPVAFVETTGGIELGATTEYGILTLGRTATEGPCRVRYFTGPSPLVEDGELRATGATFTRAEIDLKHQAVRVLARPPRPTDELVAMWTPDGVTVRALRVELADDPRVTGDVLRDPGEPLPPGATILRCTEDDLHDYEFVGLVAGRATFEGGTSAADDDTVYVYQGVDRVREMLAIPERYPIQLEPKYRPDGIVVMKPVPPKPAPDASADPSSTTDPNAEPEAAGTGSGNGNR
ncbi:MAG: hypothetical protein NXI31_10500 [bacterium]|nr:hypothetical protein [bacterium]